MVLQSQGSIATLRAGGCPDQSEHSTDQSHCRAGATGENAETEAASCGRDLLQSDDAAVRGLQSAGAGCQGQLIGQHNTTSDWLCSGAV